MKKLILIRHGETDYMQERRYCGHEDAPLNAKGIGQTKRLRSKLKNIKIDNIYSSDLKRAFQTARIAFPGRIIFKRKGLREIDFGRFSGLTFDEVNRRYPKIYKTWLSNPLNVKIPNGEGIPHFAKRVRDCFKRIINQNSNKTVALISHGGPIRVILLRLLNQDLDKFWEIEQDTTAVSIIEFPSRTVRVNTFPSGTGI